MVASCSHSHYSEREPELARQATKDHASRRGGWNDNLARGSGHFSARIGHPSWLQAEFEKAYEIKTQRVSNCQGCTIEERVLTRIVRWTHDGYELESDPRHAELVVEQLGLVDSAPLFPLVSSGLIRKPAIFRMKS